MGAHDAPHWLLPAFLRSVAALGATAPRDQIEATGRRLLERWGSGDRHHHGITHLVAVLERVDSLAQETHNPEVVRVAAWYHGAVFDTVLLRQNMRATGENKPASAALAREELLGLGVPERIADRVHELIMNLTRHDADPGDVDCLALCDADLGTLAVDPQRYKAYRRQVREEFSHIDPRDYVEARINIVTRLLARRNLFVSPLASAWEEPARQNLSAELMKLKAELATLPLRDDDDERHVLEEAHRQPAQSDRAPRAKFGRDHVGSGSAGHATRTATPEPRFAATPVTPEEDEAAELVGVPYEERRHAERNARAELDVTSAMERVPQSFRDVPRRVSILAPSAPTPGRAPTSPNAQAASPSAASPPGAESAATPSRSAEPRPSTNSAEDDESTGTLFRPVER